MNLDPDADKERVVQVLLKSESEMMQFTSVYLILVLCGQPGKVNREPAASDLRPEGVAALVLVDHPGRGCP